MPAVSTVHAGSVLTASLFHGYKLARDHRIIFPSTFIIHMAKNLRCAVIGVGAIGSDHLNSLLHCRRAASVAIADSNARRAKEAAERYKIQRSYSDYHELLEQPDIDAVTIAVPNYLHAPVAIDALKAGKHVMVEKPMALNAGEAVKIAETAEKMRRVLMVGMNYRFLAQTQLARQIIQRGDAGDLYHARCFYLRRAGIPRIGSWFTQKKLSGGGCTLDIGVHMLDASLHLFGDFDAASVMAHTHARLGPLGLGDGTWGKSEIDPRKPFDVEDYCTALIKLKSGRTVQFEMSWAGFHAPDQRESGIDLLGTAAGLTLFPLQLCRNGASGYETILPGTGKLPQPEDRIHHFVDCILDGKKPMVAPHESVKVQQILDAIYASADSGREVRFK
jgi:predicted dehydrogenase